MIINYFPWRLSNSPFHLIICKFHKSCPLNHFHEAAAGGSGGVPPNVKFPSQCGAQHTLT